MTLPGAEDPGHPGRIRRMPRHGRPIEIPHHEPATRPEDAVHFSERPVDVLDELQNLHAEGRVEGCVAHRERGCWTFMERDVGIALAALGREAQHVGAGVDADDSAAGSYEVC